MELKTHLDLDDLSATFNSAPHFTPSERKTIQWIFANHLQQHADLFGTVGRMVEPAIAVIHQNVVSPDLWGTPEHRRDKATALAALGMYLLDLANSEDFDATAAIIDGHKFERDGENVGLKKLSDDRHRVLIDGKDVGVVWKDRNYGWMSADPFGGRRTHASKEAAIAAVAVSYKEDPAGNAAMGEVASMLKGEK